jgi:hypothetical protein
MAAHADASNTIRLVPLAAEVHIGINRCRMSPLSQALSVHVFGSETAMIIMSHHVTIEVMCLCTLCVPCVA